MRPIEWYFTRRRQRYETGAVSDPFFTMLTGYRYLSWLITSSLYLATGQDQHGWFQLGVVASLLLAAVVTHGLHRAYWGQAQALVPILLFESGATLALLWPTGGLDSVFIWYAVNPILAAASNLSLRWSLGLVIGFLPAAYLMAEMPPTGLVGWLASGRVANLPDPAAVSLPWSEGPLYTTLIFLLVTVGAQALATLSRTAYRQNHELRRKSTELQEALQLREALYRLIERLAGAEDRAQVAGVVAPAARRLLAADRVEVCLGEPETGVPSSVVAGQAVPGGREVRVDLSVQDRSYGWIAAHFGPGAAAGHEDQVRATLERIGELAVAALERLRVTELNRQLSVAAEKRRIAEELHDSVAQQLFNISTACYALQHGWQELPAGEVSQRLRALGRAANVAARSLRRSIYGLAPREEAAVPFTEAIRQYAAQIEKIHGLTVACRLTGPIDAAGAEVRRTLWRVLQEAVGNALVHSGCARIQVRVAARRGACSLLVADDGRGMGQALSPAGAGLGLESMGAQARKAGGTLRVYSRAGRGTIVACRLPVAPATGGLTDPLEHTPEAEAVAR